MLYGEELHIVEAGNSDGGVMTAVNLTDALATQHLAKTMPLPGVVKELRYRPVTAVTYGSGPTRAIFELFIYPGALVAGDLATACALYNKLVVAMNAHAADATMHTTAPDTVNFPLAETPVSTLAQLEAALGLMHTAYVAHNADAIASSAWAYHVAQGTTHAVANSTAITTLVLAVAKVNDLVAKFNAHDLTLTAHAVTNLHPALKVSLGTFSPAEGDVAGRLYIVKINNKVIDQVPVQTGKAQYNAGDQLVLEVTGLAVGGTKAGTFQPYIIYSNRGENTENQVQLVDRTPAIVGI